MLGKTNDTESEKSVISSDMKIKGKISADGDLVLLGSVVGDIKCHSLSVKNPVSSKVLTLLVTLQVLSNIGILYFLYIGME